jgi:hemoglobin
MGDRNQQALSIQQVLEIKSALTAFFTTGETDRLSHVFDLFDLNNSGFLTHEELHISMNCLFQDYINVEEIVYMVDEADVDKKGTIDTADLIAVLRRVKEDPAAEDRGWGRMKRYDAIHTEQSLSEIVNRIYAKIAHDAILKHHFEGFALENIINAQHRYIDNFLGGPSPWSGRTLKEIHEGLEITSAQMDRYCELFHASAMEGGKTQEEADEIINKIKTIAAPDIVEIYEDS